MPTALITGGSRGIGAATAIALAQRGYDIALTYREKRSRAEEIVAQIKVSSRDAISIAGDMTMPAARRELVSRLGKWGPALDALVLNASGGLERSILTQRPDYAREINHDAQVGLVDDLAPLLTPGSTIVFVTSHWAHLYGRVEQLPNYEPVAASKHLGEAAMRARQSNLAERGIRLLIVTGDLVDGTITAKLLERQVPGLAASRRDVDGQLVSTNDMGVAIAAAITDQNLPSGYTIVVGASLDSLTTT